jgi:hypothetical protein
MLSAAAATAAATRTDAHATDVGIGELSIQLIDCARVPVLTIVSRTATGDVLSLDLTVDQPLGEWHVLWFLSQRAEAEPEFAPVYTVPAPRPDGWEQGLEAAALRCVKWWLRRRRIPVSKEGGFPTVTWTFMVIHVLRCSLFLKEAHANGESNISDSNEHALLGALATFFDRFAEGGPAGTLLFSSGRAEFWPRPSSSSQTSPFCLPEAAHLSVLDPTTTDIHSVHQGIQPLDLAPTISPATRLLHAAELRRAAQLSTVALISRRSAQPTDADDDQQSSETSSNALLELFAEAGEGRNTVPVALPAEESGVAAAAILIDGNLKLGVLKEVYPKPGWNAPFLHRGDWRSRLLIEPYCVDESTGEILPETGELIWFTPVDFVCAVNLEVATREFKPMADDQESPMAYILTKASLEHWRELHATLLIANPTPR